MTACLGVASIVTAGTNDTKPIATSTVLLDGDIQILAHVHAVNEMEIEVGKLALTNGTSFVKSYANILIRDHQAADKDLLAFAHKHGVVVPSVDIFVTEQDRKDQVTAQDNLKKLKGGEFDREFVAMMIAGHDTELTRIDAAIGSADNADLITMLKGIKPTLQAHARDARQLQQQLNAKS